jgi:hypothetical protein
MGQVFTAEDPHVKIGFGLIDCNPSTGAIEIGIELYQGAGVIGTFLGSAPVLGLSDGFDGFYDADFSPITLIPGGVYTAILTSISERGAVYWNNNYEKNGDLYADGYLLMDGEPMEKGVYPYNTVDTRFHVLPVPVPGAFLLGCIGLGYSGWRLRRRTA